MSHPSARQSGNAKPSSGFISLHNETPTPPQTPPTPANRPTQNSPRNTDLIQKPTQFAPSQQSNQSDLAKKIHLLETAVQNRLKRFELKTNPAISADLQTKYPEINNSKLQLLFAKLIKQEKNFDQKQLRHTAYVKLITATTALFSLENATSESILQTRAAFNSHIGKFKQNHTPHFAEQFVKGLLVILLVACSAGTAIPLIPSLLKSTWYNGAAFTISNQLTQIKAFSERTEGLAQTTMPPAPTVISL